MKALKKHIYDEKNGLDYILICGYYFPDLRLPEETRPIGRWGRMHREYLESITRPDTATCSCPASSGRI